MSTEISWQTILGHVADYLVAFYTLTIGLPWVTILSVSVLIARAITDIPPAIKSIKKWFKKLKWKR